MDVNGNKYRYEISILLLQYNSEFEKTKRTLKSIILQENIKLEIIIADDGSIHNHQERIVTLFTKYGFTDYKLVMNPTNNGTVKNYISGLEVCEGQYIKSISPGDYLCNNNTLRNWIDFLKLSKRKWSFGDAIYYDEKSGKPISVDAHPRVIKPYIHNNGLLMRWHYLVFRDIALGATMLSTSDIQRYYCRKILNSGVKYAEDNIWRLMMFDGIIPAYYNQNVIYYEYGGGVSTSNNPIWKDRLLDDIKKTDTLMIQSTNTDNFQRQIIKGISPQKTIIEKIMIKGKLKYYIYCKIFKRMTPLK